MQNTAYNGGAIQVIYTNKVLKSQMFLVLLREDRIKMYKYQKEVMKKAQRWISMVSVIQHSMEDNRMKIKKGETYTEYFLKYFLAEHVSGSGIASCKMKDPQHLGYLK